MNNEQYDFYSYGMRVARDLYSNAKTIADDIEKKYGEQAKLEFESGIAVSIPTYSTYFSNQDKIENIDTIRTSVDFNESHSSNNFNQNNSYIDNNNSKETKEVTREDAIKLIKLGVIEENNLKLLSSDDKEIILDYIKKQKIIGYNAKPDNVVTENINIITKYFNNDKEIVHEAVKKVPLCIQYASNELKNDKNIILSALESYTKSRISTEVFQYASDSIKNDKEYILYLIQKNSSFDGIIKYAGDSIKNDRDVISELLNDKADWMEYAGDTIKDDKEFILQEISKRPAVIKYISNSLQNDKEFLLNTLKQNHQCFRYFNEELRNNKEFVMEAIKIHCYCFANISNELKNDEEIINLTLQQKNLSNIKNHHFSQATGIRLDYHGNVDYIIGVDTPNHKRR